MFLVTFFDSFPALLTLLAVFALGMPDREENGDDTTL
jgi:hypothetical protein